MGLTMSEKKAITKEVAKRYRKARKKEKGGMLNEFVATTGYNRNYAAWVLRNWYREIGRYLHNGDKIVLVKERNGRLRESPLQNPERFLRARYQSGPLPIGMRISPASLKQTWWDTTGAALWVSTARRLPPPIFSPAGPRRKRSRTKPESGSSRA
ncbi:MAG: hypothetical protein ABIK20_03425 [Candidatus Omnitrophota bacterium]|nr:hypothetical protein [Candidatus Omnitrophota bacterium]